MDKQARKEMLNVLSDTIHYRGVSRDSIIKAIANYNTASDYVETASHKNPMIERDEMINARENYMRVYSNYWSSGLFSEFLSRLSDTAPFLPLPPK